MIYLNNGELIGVIQLIIFAHINNGVSTILNLKDACSNMTFVLQIKPSKIKDALEDEQWKLTMQE